MSVPDDDLVGHRYMEALVELRGAGASSPGGSANFRHGSEPDLGLFLESSSAESSVPSVQSLGPRLSSAK